MILSYRVADRKRQGESIKDLCAAYLEGYAKVHKKSWQEDQRRIDNRILPAGGSLKARAITRCDVAALHSKIGGKEGHPYEANRVRELIAKMFELAHLWGFVPEGHHNPAKGALAEILDRQMATKAEVTDHENNLQHAIEVLRLELKRDLAETNARIAETKAELTRWVIGAGVLQTTIIIGVLLKVVKLV